MFSDTRHFINRAHWLSIIIYHLLRPTTTVSYTKRIMANGVDVPIKRSYLTLCVKNVGEEPNAGWQWKYSSEVNGLRRCVQALFSQMHHQLYAYYLQGRARIKTWSSNVYGRCAVNVWEHGVQLSASTIKFNDSTRNFTVKKQKEKQKNTNEGIKRGRSVQICTKRKVEKNQITGALLDGEISSAGVWCDWKVRRRKKKSIYNTRVWSIWNIENIIGVISRRDNDYVRMMRVIIYARILIIISRINRAFLSKCFWSAIQRKTGVSYG